MMIHWERIVIHEITREYKWKETGQMCVCVCACAQTYQHVKDLVYKDGRGEGHSFSSIIKYMFLERVDALTPPACYLKETETNTSLLWPPTLLL